MKSLRLSYFELHDIHLRVKWKSERGQKLALSPEKKLLTFHKVLKLPEVHEDAVRLVFTVWHFLTTGVLFCENGIFLWFCPFFRNSSVSYQPRSQPVAFGALACPDRPQACPEILSPNFLFIISVIISPGYSLIRARRLSLVHREKELDESADWV